MTSRRKRKARDLLVYDGIELIPVDLKDYPKHKREQFRNAWHIPGGSIMKTNTLVHRAKARGHEIQLKESRGAQTRLVSLK